MAFFPRNFYGSDASFTPLFRLLDDFDSYNRQAGSGRQHRHSIPTFQPKFDVRETDNSYELHGELAGMNKDDVHIEFTDPHTMLVRGRIERSYSSGTPPAALEEESKTTAAITEAGEENGAAKQSHQATVEDEDASTVQENTPATTSAELAETPEEKPKKADKSKYWVTERSIGEFSRSFNFPTHVQQDAVNAALRDGVLNITVPKAKKHEARRIAVN